MGREVQGLLEMGLGGSIVGVMIFQVLLELKIIGVWWVNEGGELVLKRMVFLFIGSVVGVMDVV